MGEVTFLQLKSTHTENYTAFRSLSLYFSLMQDTMIAFLIGKIFSAE